MQELTDEELDTCIASLERAVEGDDASQVLRETDSTANPAGPLAEGDAHEEPGVGA